MTKKCENCGTVLDKGDIHCPECGEQYNPKPVINKGTLIGLILLTIFIFPLGIIVSILVFVAHRQEVKDWQMERLIAKDKP
jgi:uncharacterized protein (UPF0212 family)